MPRRDYDDDDDRDDDRPRRRPRYEPRPSSGGNTAVKIIAIIGGVILTIVLVCGGTVYFAVNRFFKFGEESIAKMQEQQKNSNRAKSQAAADTFIRNLKAKRFDEAFQMTTANCRKKHANPVALEEFVKDNPKIKDVNMLIPKDFGENATIYNFEDTMFAQGGGFNKLEVTVVLEGADWKIDRLEINPK